MRKWKTVNRLVGNLEINLNELEHQGYSIFTIIPGICNITIVANKLIIPNDQPSAQGSPTQIKLGEK